MREKPILRVERERERERERETNGNQEKKQIPGFHLTATEREEKGLQFYLIIHRV